MKLAIISVTSQGAELGQCLAAKLAPDYACSVYEKAGRESWQAQATATSYASLQPLLQEIWQQHDAFVFIMAVGIVVRDIAKLIKHKSVDPAVLVMDELGCNCISLLSGHLGGANALTKVVAGLVGANPVITTASDLNGLVAPDAVAGKLNLAVESYELLKKINGKIVAREKVGFYVDPALPEAAEFIARAQTYGLDFALWQDGLSLEENQGLVFVSENTEKKLPWQQVLYLRPKNIIAGMGCRRGMSAADLYQALQSAFKQSGYSLSSLQAITSAWLKADEEGLLALAQQLHVPIKFYDEKTLQASIEKNKLSESEFVKKEIGVGNVCEAAALAHSQQAVLVKNKQSYGQITVALARVNFLL